MNSDMPATRYSLPWSIPPHGYATLRVLWISNACPPAHGWVSVSAIPLRVRVGLITRTEIVPLESPEFALGGPGDAQCTTPVSALP